MSLTGITQGYHTNTTVLCHACTLENFKNPDPTTDTRRVLINAIESKSEVKYDLLGKSDALKPPNYILN